MIVERLETTRRVAQRIVAGIVLTLAPFSAWASSLSVIPEAALHGDRGLRVTVDDGNPAFVQDDLEGDVFTYRLRFYALFQQLQLENLDSVDIFAAYNQNDDIAFLVRINREGTDLLFRVLARDFTAGFVESPTVTISSTAWHTFELNYAEGNGDGRIDIFVDGVERTGITGLNTDTKGSGFQFLRYVRLGAVSAFSNTARHRWFDLDSFESSPGAPLNEHPTTSGLPFQSGNAGGMVSLNAANFFDDAEDTGGGLTYSVVGNTIPDSVGANFDGTTLNLLFLEQGGGTGDITVRGTDTGNLFVDSTFMVFVNARPTTTGINDVVVPENSPPTEIDLFAAFDDAEDDDSQLALSVQSVTNPALFSQTSIDAGTGILTLGYAADTFGNSDITVRATDTSNLFVETTFTVTVTEVVEGMGEGAGEGMGEGVGEGAGEGMGEGAGEGAGEGMGEGVGEGMGEGAGEGTGEGAGEGASEGAGEGMGEGAGEGAAEGVGEGAGDGMGEGGGEGIGEGAGEGTGEGAAEGEGEGDGEGKDSGCGIDSTPGTSNSPAGNLLFMTLVALVLFGSRRRVVKRG